MTLNPNGSSNNWKAEYARYIGQTNKNGVPDGYGYYEACFVASGTLSGTKDGKDVSIEWSNKRVISKTGSWKEGYIEGYYTLLSLTDNVTMSGRTLASIKEIGCKKDGEDVGEFASYTDYGEMLEIRKKNYDTCDDLVLCDDGAYRTSYETYEWYSTEWYSTDGTYG